MTRLVDLRKRLARLRRRRRLVRWGTGYTALALAVLWIFAAVFALDWLFEKGILAQRIVLLALAALGIIWAFRRFTVPWLGKRETDLDMALLVEKQEHIDSDLIAAVQFESPEAPEWGSQQLEQAVIDSVADRTRKLNVMRGLSRRRLKGNVAALVLTAAAWVGFGWAFPGHLSAFLNRVFLLSSVHYPTNTLIEKITINDQPISPSNPAATPVRVLYAKPVHFEVTFGGVKPEQGKVELRASRSGLTETLLLQPESEGSDRFVGQLDELREAVEYQIYLGDAWTDPGELTAAALPAVQLEMEVVPPEYARTETPAATPPGLRQISVIEGSEVRVKVRSDKPLKDVTLAIEKDRLADNGSQQEYQLESIESQADASEQDDTLWMLKGENTPFEAVTESLRFQVQVTDRDGQTLEQPIKAVIRIRADAPPRVAAAVVTRYVLPTARPNIYFRAVDDYALARVFVFAEILREDGQVEEREVELYRRTDAEPLVQDLRRDDTGVPFDLGPLQVEKGDQVKMTLRATDYRGEDREGRTTSAESLVLQVTDEEGIYASMMEADQVSARQLKDMIQRQLGIGESP